MEARTPQIQSQLTSGPWHSSTPCCNAVLMAKCCLNGRQTPRSEFFYISDIYGHQCSSSSERSNCEERVFNGSSGCRSVKLGRFVALFAYSKDQDDFKDETLSAGNCTYVQTWGYILGIYTVLSTYMYYWAAIKRFIMRLRQLQVFPRHLLTGNSAACRYGFRKLSQGQTGRLGHKHRSSNYTLDFDPLHKAVTAEDVRPSCQIVFTVIRTIPVADRRSILLCFLERTPQGLWWDHPLSTNSEKYFSSWCCDSTLRLCGLLPRRLAGRPRT